MASPELEATSVSPFELAPCPYSQVRALIEGIGVAEPVAATLVRRGYTSVAEARAFLEAEETHDPFLFEGMASAVALLEAAVAKGRTITVHGDYDVDGVCSTAILVSVLRGLGARCDWFIPDRLADGYGLTRSTVERLAERGTEVLVAVDCGIGCPDEVGEARRLGLDVIVADHHQPGERLPDCPILHPVLSGYPCRELCATGVAFKVAEALMGGERASRELDLVALATVADLVPLRGENRALVRRGLREIRRARRPGLRALMAAAATDPSSIDEGDLAFRLGPRINAAGRLYRADAGVELLLTDDEARASAIAAELDRANRERRATEREVLYAAERARTELPDEVAAPALVLAGEGWHAGVVGIVASRLVERHGVPSVLLAIDRDGRARGSGRSIPGFDLLAALRACDKHLGRYGGHKAAAGLELDVASIGPFRKAFAAYALTVLGERPSVQPESIDAVVGGESLGLDVAEQLERLGPFGVGNPRVRLLVPRARVSDVRGMGEGDKHARFRLQSGPRSAMGVAFGVNGDLSRAGDREALDVSVRLEVNNWNGAVEPRVILGELYPDRGGAEGDESADAVHRLEDEEWWERFDRELASPLEDWPPSPVDERAEERRREVIERRECSGVAAVAALAASGEPVVAITCDAMRRRALVDRWVPPRRFGGGMGAIVSGRLSAAGRGAGRAVLERGAGVVLTDWTAMELDPSLCSGFPHVVLVDPPSFPHLRALANRDQGFLHPVWGDPEVDLSLRVHDLAWPAHAALAEIYRLLAPAPTGLAGRPLREALAGGGAYGRSPEAAARCLRVLVELDLISWQRSGADRAAVVLSSEGKNLHKSAAFIAYEGRHEEGRRFLNSQRQAS